MRRFLLLAVALLLGGSLSLGAQTLTSISIAAPISTSLNPVGQEQLLATCFYSDGTNDICNTADVHGTSVTSWGTTNSSVISVSPLGVVTGGVVGSASITVNVISGTPPSQIASVSGPLAMTVVAATLTITSVTTATTGSVTSIPQGSTNQLIETCHYSNSTSTTCTTTDIHGYGVSSWASASPSIATVNSTGLVTGVGAGTTNFTATVTF